MGKALMIGAGGVARRSSFINVAKIRKYSRNFALPAAHYLNVTL